MPLLMSHAQWMKRTHSRVKPRSSTLKALDDAIQRRDEAGARRALIAWIDGQNKKRQDWHRSVRTSDHAVEELHKQLNVLGAGVTYRSVGEEMDDKLAKAHIRREQRLAKSRMFQGSTLRFKDSFWGISRKKCEATRNKYFNAVGNVALTTKGVGGNLAGAGLQAYSVANGLKQTIQTIMGTLQPATQNAIIEQVFGTGVATFVAEAAPYLGMATSGVKAVSDWGQVAKNIHDATVLESRVVDIRSGDPTAALDAVVKVIDRAIEKQTADGVIHTTAFTAKAAAAAADTGTATTAIIGAAETIAILLNMLADLCIEASQMEAGNKLIQEGNFDLELFNSCPILGCYYVVIQDHSTIMDFDIANMGKDNWKQEAERLRYAIQPVIKKSSQLIGKARIEIKGSEQAKGVYQRSLMNALKLHYKSKGYGQGKNSHGIGSADFDIFEAVARGDV